MAHHKYHLKLIFFISLVSAILSGVLVFIFASTNQLSKIPFFFPHTTPTSTPSASQTKIVKQILRFTNPNPNLQPPSSKLINPQPQTIDAARLAKDILTQVENQLTNHLTQLILATKKSGLAISTSQDHIYLTNTDRGSQQNIFKNIAVSGQTTIVASNNDDTLTLASSGDLSITTNADTKTVTFTVNSSSPDYTQSGWTHQDNHLYLTTSTDKVGIGTTTPTTKLEVNGDLYANGGQIRLGNFTTTPTAIGAGALYYNSNNNQPYYYNGSNWVSLHPTSTFLSLTDTPNTYSPGHLLFMTDSNVSSTNDLFWDNNNHLFGIGTTTPIAKLHLEGRTSGKALAIFNETGDQDIFTASKSGNTKFVITNEGRVGIGISNPLTPLEIYSEFGTPNPNSSESDHQQGFYYKTIFTPTESSLTGTAGGGVGVFQVNTPTGITTTAQDHYFSGFRSLVRKMGPGTVTEMISIGGGWHWFNEGHVDNFYNLYATRLSQGSTGTGTVGNAFGVYIAGQKQSFVTQAYGLYQDGSDDINYFAGSVGIGTTSPTAKLEVAGNLNISNNGQLQFTGGNPYISSIFDEFTLMANSDTNGTGIFHFYTDANTDTLNLSNQFMTLPHSTGIVAYGGYGTGATLTVSSALGGGNRFIWYPKKAAFRAGYVDADEWDDINIGNYSTAFGVDTVASGLSSFAFGDSSNALGAYSFAGGQDGNAESNYSFSFGSGTDSAADYAITFGSETTANATYAFAGGDNTQASGSYAFVYGSDSSVDGNYAFAFGNNAYAGGDYSLAFGNEADSEGLESITIGNNTIANGDQSIAIGPGTNAEGYRTIVLGSYNDGDDSVYSDTWDGDDPLLIVGNGSDSLNLSTAITLLKNGNLGIGTTAPTALLQVGESGDGTSAVANAWNTFSDIRFKDHIQPIDHALDKVLQLEGVYYDWKNSGRHSIGFIAQQVQPILPEIVSQDKNGYLSLDYSRFTPVLVQALKEQNSLITNNTNQITNLNTTVFATPTPTATTSSAIDKLKSQLDHLTQSLEQTIINTVTINIKSILASIKDKVVLAGEWVFDKLTAKEVKVEKLCVTNPNTNQETCITQDQLQQLLQLLPSPTPSPTPTPSPSPTPTTSPSPTPTPTPTPSPTASPSPTPTP